MSRETIVEPYDSDRVSDKTIAALHLEMRRWQIEQGQNTFSNILDSQVDLMDIDGHYIEPGGNFFTARDSTTGDIAGFVGLMKAGEHEGVLKRLAVLPEHHRRGIGSLLVGSLVDWARENDYTPLTLGTGEHENAKPIYERYGFVETGRVIRNRDYIMRLDLA